MARELGKSLDRSPASAAAGLFAQSVRVGLLGGFTWGCLQTLKLTKGATHYMDLRQWADVLSFSAGANGLLWMLNGAFFGALCALIFLILPPFRRFVRPGALAVGLFSAGAITFLVWVITSEHMPRAAGIQSGWLMGMVLCWVVVLVGAYGLSHVLAPTLPGRIFAFAGRWAVWPVLLAMVISAGIQWYERPQILSGSAAWQESTTAHPLPEGSRPNVLFVVLDTQRRDRMGCYGYERDTSPCFDRFAEESLVFDNYISTAVWTLPSHASMFTGLYSSEHGSNWNHVWLDDEFTTMAEILKEMEYQSFGVSSNLVVAPTANLAQGFDGFIRPRIIVTARGNYIYKFLDRVLFPAGRVGTWLGKYIWLDQGAKYNNQIVARWLARRDRERPFFIFVNYLEPHDPFRPTDPYRKLFVAPEDMRDSYRLDWNRVDEFAIMGRDVYSAEDLEILNDTYDADTRFTDDYLGQLLEIVAAEASLDETLVIITSDHGENLGDHHLLRHAWCVYDSLARLPLLVRYPPRTEPGRVAEISQTVDLLPTVLDAVNGEPPSAGAFHGRSLISPVPATEPDGPAEEPDPEIEQDPALAELTGRPAITEYNAPSRKFVNDAQQKYLRVDRTSFESTIHGIRQGPWKYITGEDGRQELYRWTEDRGELNNLIDDHPIIARRLAEQLEQWRATLTPYVPRIGGVDEGQEKTDEDTLSRLRELGYIQ